MSLDLPDKPRSKHRSAQRHARLWRATGWILFAGTATLLIVLTVAVKRKSSNLDRENAKLSSVIDDHQQRVDAVEQQIIQSQRDKLIMMKVLRLCREASDIPRFGGGKIVALQQGVERLLLHVPDGQHILNVAMSWDGKSGPIKSGNEDWSVSLSGPTAYLLVLDIPADRGGKPLKWELSSSDERFQPQRHPFPLTPFEQNGSSWSGSGGTVRFPNELTSINVGTLDAAIVSPPPIVLSHRTLSGKVGQQQLDVDINVTCQSDGPACVSASYASRVIANGMGDRLQPYRGDGKYELKVPGAEAGQPGGD